MTKKELIEELAEYPDDAIIDVRLPEDGGDCNVEGVVEVYVSNTGRDTWITLGVR